MPSSLPLPATNDPSLVEDDDEVEPNLGTMAYLASKNAHPRDAAISFEEIEHLYTIHHDARPYKSVTTLNGEMFAKFDAPKVAANIANTANCLRKPEYRYRTAKQIEAQWTQSGNLASSAGTALHLDIERFFNGVEVKDRSSIEFKYFTDFWRQFGSGFGLPLSSTSPSPLPTPLPAPLVPYRTEWCVWYEEYQLAGSIDMLFENPDGSLQIYDWKRTIKSLDPSYQGNPHRLQYGTVVGLDAVPDNAFWHYALQLNMYKRILETKYGKTVTDLFLVCLHPNNPGYLRVPVPFIPDLVDCVLRYRTAQLEGTESSLVVRATTLPLFIPETEDDDRKTEPEQWAGSDEDV